MFGSFFQITHSDPTPELGIVPILENDVTIEVPRLDKVGSPLAPMFIDAQGNGKGSIEATSISTFLITLNQLAAGAIIGMLKGGQSPFTVHYNLKQQFYHDGGQNWSRVFQVPMSIGSSQPYSCARFEWDYSSTACVTALLVDPTTPSNAYAGTSAGVFKSSDRGATWSPFNTGLSSMAVQQGVLGLACDVEPAGETLYVGASDGLYKFNPGSTSWTPTTLTADVRNITVDPTTTPHTLYTTSDSAPNTFMSVDGGATWLPLNIGGGNPFFDIAVDTATTPSTIYGYEGFVYRSTDGGSTWSQTYSEPYFGPVNDGGPIFVDTTTSPSSIYFGDSDNGVYQSIDGGISWVSIGFPTNAMAVVGKNGSVPTTLYIGTQAPYPDAFVAELDPSGSTVLFSTYLGGLLSTTLGNAIAIDASDNIYIAGYIFPAIGWQLSQSSFPIVNAFDSFAPSLSGLGYAFFAKIGDQVLPAASASGVTAQVGVQTGTLTITLPNITGSTAGTQPTLTVTPLSSASTANFSLSNNLGAYDISTTATFTASTSDPVTLCFQALTVNDLSTFNNLRLIHVVNETPVDVTSSRDFSTRSVCGSVTSLSPFILISPAPPAIT